jgi:hypothetical protein
MLKEYRASMYNVTPVFYYSSDAENQEPASSNIGHESY